MALFPSLTLWIPFLLILPLLLLMKRKVEGKGNEFLPPGPFKLPIIGNLHQLGSLPHVALTKLSHIYGPVMFLKLGSVPTLIVSSPEAAKEVLKVHDLDTCSRPPLFGAAKLSYNYLDVTFAPYGDYWREMKKIFVNELLSVKRIQSFRHIREEEVASLIDSLAQSPSSGGVCPVVNLGEKFYNLTANITCKVAFGKRFQGSGFDGDKFSEKIQEATVMLNSFAGSDFFPSMGLGWMLDRITGLHGRLESMFHELDTFYDQVIDDHLSCGQFKQEKQQDEDIVDVLLRIEKDSKEHSAVQHTRNHIKGCLMDVFLAGVDTSAVTLGWAMAELARSPRVLKKAQDEVRSVKSKEGKIAESQLDQLQFLKMMIKETLRLHPPIPLLVPRESMTPFTLNGYNINPKTRIHINAWAIARDPRIWKVPEDFFPERFLDGSIDFRGQNFEFLPFGSGRRACPGIYMGIVIVELALANLLNSFDWKLPNGMKEEDMDMEELNALTVSKKSALNLVPVIHQWPKIGNEI